MILETPIVGKHVKLRSVECDDAQFILDLRLNEAVRPFISPTVNDIEKQKQWIKTQRERLGDYYFLYTDLNDVALGVISIYNIYEQTGELGRQVGLENSLANMEAEYLTMCFAFETLGLREVVGTTYTTNTKIISKSKKLGYVLDKIVKVNGIDSYYLPLKYDVFCEKWKPRMETILSKFD